MFRIDKNFVKIQSPADLKIITSVETNSPGPGEKKETKPQTPDPAQATREITKAAEKKAAAILQKAEEEAKSIRSQARRSGYQEGKDEALASYEVQMKKSAESVRALIREIESARDVMFERFEDDIINLSLSVAGKIVNAAIDRDAENKFFESMVVNALKQMKREGKILVRVSEEQFNTFFSAGSATFVLGGDESVTVSVEGDPTLKKHDLILESDGETVNAGADSQLKYIAIAFGRPGDAAL